MLITAVQESAKAELTAGTELPNSVSIGLDLGTLAGIQPAGAIVGSDPESLFIPVSSRDRNISGDRHHGS